MKCMQVGSLLRRRRGVLGLSISEAARAVGVSHTTWMRWESEVDVPIRYLDAVSRTLGISVVFGNSDKTPTYRLKSHRAA